MALLVSAVGLLARLPPPSDDDEPLPMETQTIALQAMQSEYKLLDFMTLYFGEALVRFYASLFFKGVLSC